MIKRAKQINFTLLISFLFASLYFAIFSSAAFIYIPVILILSALLKFHNLSASISIFISCIFVSIASSAKTLQGDLIAYNRYYVYVAENDLQTIFYAWLSESSIRTTEFIFKIYNYIYSSLGFNFLLFHSISIAIIYACMLSFSLQVDKIIGEKTKRIKAVLFQDKIFAILWTLLVAVSFTLTSQVLKQYLSMALLSISIMFYLQDRKLFLAILFMLAAIFTHNSTAIILPIVIFGYFYRNYLNTNIFRFLLMVSAFIFGFILTNLIDLLGLSALLFYGGMESPDLGITLILDMLLLVIALFVLPQNIDNTKINLLKAIVITFICFLIFARDIPIILLRVYFYMDIIRIFLGIYIYHSFNKNDRSLILILLAFIGPIYWNLKLFSSNWDYSWYTLSDNLIQILK